MDEINMEERKFKTLSDEREELFNKANKEAETKEERASIVSIFTFIHYQDKEFIKISEARIANQLRIHWNWLKKKNPKEVAEFINNIIDKRAGPKLTNN